MATKKKLTKKQESDIQSLILQIAVIKARAMELGMYRTGHLLDDALNHCGWELAGKLEDNQ